MRLHRLRAGGFRLFDTQFLTPHLASLGAVEITRADYHRRLSDALAQRAVFAPEGSGVATEVDLIAHAGDGAHSMLRTLIADLPRVRTPWEQVLRRQLARGLAPLPELSWIKDDLKSH